MTELLKPFVHYFDDGKTYFYLNDYTDPLLADNQSRDLNNEF